jgi:hypothetical protein
MEKLFFLPFLVKIFSSRALQSLVLLPLQKLKNQCGSVSLKRKFLPMTIFCVWIFENSSNASGKSFSPPPSKNQDLERLDCRIFIILTSRFNKHIESSINIEIFVFMMFGTTKKEKFQGLMDQNLSFFSVASDMKDERIHLIGAFAELLIASLHSHQEFCGSFIASKFNLKQVNLCAFPSSTR